MVLTATAWRYVPLAEEPTIDRADAFPFRAIPIDQLSRFLEEMTLLRGVLPAAHPLWQETLTNDPRFFERVHSLYEAVVKELTR